MKYNVFLNILYFLTLAVIAVNTVLSAVQSLTPDMSDLPQGSFIGSRFSPENTSQVDFYLVSNTIGTAIRGEKVSGGNRTNIYWQTGIGSADVEWLDEYSIVINDIPLNLKTDKFDSRRGTAIFSDGVLAENINAEKQ